MISHPSFPLLPQTHKPWRLMQTHTQLIRPTCQSVGKEQSDSRNSAASLKIITETQMLPRIPHSMGNKRTANRWSNSCRRAAIVLNGRSTLLEPLTLVVQKITACSASVASKIWREKKNICMPAAHTKCQLQSFWTKHVNTYWSINGKAMRLIIDRNATRQIHCASPSSLLQAPLSFLLLHPSTADG